MGRNGDDHLFTNQLRNDGVAHQNRCRRARDSAFLNELSPARVVCHRSRHLNSNVGWPDRKSTRLNSSHSQISYAVFCLKKKKKLITVALLSQLFIHAPETDLLVKYSALA